MSLNKRGHAGPHASISTPDLVLRALEQQHTHGPGMDDEDLSYLVELHARTDRAPYEMAVRLVGSTDAHERILGLRILSELGPWSMRTFRVGAVPLLRRTIETYQSDPETLYWALKALAWQGDKTAVDDLLRFVDDADDAVRAAAMSNLDQFLDRHEVRHEILAALLRGTTDSNSEIRYSATSAIANWLDVTREDIQRALVRRLDDDDGLIRCYAAAGLARSDAGWHQLVAHHPLPEVRIGAGDPEWIAWRPVSNVRACSDTAIVVRGQYAAWSGLTNVREGTWLTWLAAIPAYRSNHKAFTMRLDADLNVRLTLDWHPEGIPRLTCRIGTTGKHWHEREHRSFCWQLREHDVDGIEQGLIAVTTWAREHP